MTSSPVVRRVVLLAGLSILAFAPACMLSDEMQSQEGVGLSPEERAHFVEERARPPIAALESTQPVTLAELLARVEDGSVDLAQVRAQVAQAGAGVEEARAALRPNIAINANLQSKAQAPGNGFFQQDRQVAGFTVDLSIPLDLSGRLAESVRAAQARYRSAEQRLLASGREQRFLVSKAYFMLLEAQELREVNRASLAAQEREFADAQARFDTGLLRRNDVLVVEVTIANTRQAGVQIESSVLQARRALNAAVGLAIDHPTEVAPWNDLISVPADVVALLDRALTRNPEVDVLIETRQALLHELESNRRANWPEVSVGPQITYTSEKLSTPNANFAGFLSFSWNPDFNGRLEAQAGGLEAQILASTWAVTGVLRQLEQRILESHRRAIEKQSALRTAENSVGQAQENLRILEEQLRAGVTTGREVLEGVALVAEQEGTRRTARHQANSAVFELMYAAGTDPLDFTKSASGR